MFGDDERDDSFEEMLLSIAREVSQGLERAAQAYVDELADSIGVDPLHARAWFDNALGWLRERAQGTGDGSAGRAAHAGTEDAAAGRREPRERPDRAARAQQPARSGPRPVDLPTAEQGVALAALDSGRWAVQPGSHAFLTRGEGPQPSDALDLVGELRARDWIAPNGELTPSGRDALRRWLGAVTHHVSS